MRSLLWRHKKTGMIDPARSLVGMIFFTFLTLCLRAVIYRIREVPGLYSGALAGRICLEQKKAVSNIGRSNALRKRCR